MKSYIRLFISILSAVIIASFPAYAGPQKGKVPMMPEIDEAGFGRLCYSGHTGDGISYCEGLAIMPDTCFELKTPEQKNRPQGDPEFLALEISLIYENRDKTGTVRELIRKCDRGSLDINTKYSFLSELAVMNLMERGRLYSDSLMSLELSLIYGSEHPSTERYYYYICSEEEYMDFVSVSDQMFDDAEEGETDSADDSPGYLVIR